MSSLTSQTYSVGRPSEHCAATGVELTPGMRFVAALCERAGEEGFDRLDYTEEAWDAGEAAPPRLFGFWRSVVPDRDAKPKPLVDDDALLSLFEQLGDSDDDKRLVFRYALALMLIRKRIIRQERAEQTESGSDLVVRLRGPKGWGEDARLERVVDPGLDREAILSVMDQLGQVMRGEE